MVVSTAVVVGFGVAGIVLMRSRHRSADLQVKREVIRRRVEESVTATVSSAGYHQVA